MSERHPQTGKVRLDRIEVHTSAGTVPARTFAAADAAIRAAIAAPRAESAAGRVPIPVTVVWRNGVTQRCLVDPATPALVAHLLAVNAQLRAQAVQGSAGYEEAGAQRGAEKQRRYAGKADTFLAEYQLEDDVPL